MRPFLIGCLLILAQLPAIARERHVDAKMILVRLANTNSFETSCGKSHPHVYACTQFVGQSLASSCSRSDRFWRLRSTAKYIALVYVVNSDFLYHEFLHLRDMEKAVGGFVSTLEQRDFPSEEACRGAAFSAAEAFGATMRRFADESTASRD